MFRETTDEVIIMHSANPFQWMTFTTTLLSSIAITLLLAACAATTPTVQEQQIIAAATAPGNTDALLVVDCLLPGKVRKLGQSMTYLAARRPIQTTAGDCEIRGGEYVLYDRASYTSALKIWMPQAQAGDPVAQTYVGEIYERGLGTPPDYNQAAQWYRKAADQGNARAQINLGALYEQGKGVPRDSTKAINLYRQASGLSGDQLAFTSSIQQLRTERDTSVQEVSLRRQESERLRRELRQTQQLLAKERDRLRASQRELERALRQLEQRTPSTSGAPSRPDPELARRLASQQALLEEQNQKIAFLQQEAKQQQAQLSSELQATQRREQALRQDVALRTQETKSLKQQVSSLEEQLNSRRAGIETTRRELEQSRQELQQQTNTGGSQQEIQTLKKRIAQREAQLEQQRQEMATLQQTAERRQNELNKTLQSARQEAQAQARETKSLQQQVDYLQDQVIASRDKLKARDQELESQKASLREAEQAVERQKREMATQSQQSQADIERNAAELKRLQQQVSLSKAKLAEIESEKATLEAEVNLRKANLAALTPTPETSAGSEATTRGGVESPPALPKLNFGRYHALVIGNNNYANFPNLKTAVSDAQAMAQVLRSRYGFNVKVLTNATRHSILTELNRFRGQLTENDNFLLYYAGHGELDKINNHGHWLPVDAEPDSTANWIANGNITRTLNAMSAKHIMVIADSCYSGSLTRQVTTSIEGGRSEAKRRKWLEKMIKTPSRTVMTSGGLAPVLDSGGGNHSVFAKVLLGVLRNNNEVLEGTILYRKIAGRVKAAAAKLNADQDPQYAPIKFAGDLGAPFFFSPS